MICQCGAETSHIKVVHGIESCPSCTGIGENRMTDDLITRNSARIRIESLKHEGELQSPRRYDKASKKIVPNEEFLKRNKERAQNFFSKAELDQSGYNKLSKRIEKFDKEVEKEAREFKKDVEFHGDQSKRIKEILK